MFRSRPCASPRHCPQRIDRTLEVLGGFHKTTFHIHRRLHTTNEKGVSGEHHALFAILHKEADTILSMTRRMQGLDGDPLADFELLAVGWGLGDELAVLASNYWELAELLQLEQSDTTHKEQPWK